MLKSQQRLRSEAHNVSTEDINQIVLGRHNKKRLETFDRITSYSFGTDTGKICRTEPLNLMLCNI